MLRRPSWWDAPKETLQPCWDIWASKPSKPASGFPATAVGGSLWHPVDRAEMLSPPLSPEHSSSSPSPRLSTESNIAPTPGPLYIVKFKGGRSDVFTSEEPLDFGDFVLVDADRGRDLGRIVATDVSRIEAAALKQQQHEMRQQVLAQCSANCNKEPMGVIIPKNVLRKASVAEVRQMAPKLRDEEAAVAYCNQKVREHQLDMSIVDAEYQWDHRKLTFFYRAGHRVDFRELVRELFRTYKTRIWMCAVPDMEA